MVTYQQLAYIHLLTVVPAFVLGTTLMVMRKGPPLHRKLGKAYMVLMATTALITLSMPAQAGPTILGHFGFIHFFSFQVAYGVPQAWLAARRGDIKKHRSNMIGIYVGGLLIAGSFAVFSPGRMVHDWLFN
jgi:uncharacterized membrane protein